MILGIGLDLVEVSRMQKVAADPGLMSRMFHADEIAYINRGKEDPAMLCAACFAVKEAFGKATGEGLRGLRLTDIILNHHPTGRPLLALAGTARARFEEIGGEHVHVSLSHESTMVSAVVIVEGSRDAG